MIVIPNAPAYATVGWLLAVLILILVIVFWALGQIDAREALIAGGLALARIL
jgi:hypothetical protein